MVRRTGDGGFSLVKERFEAMRPAMERLQAMDQAHGRMTPVGAALDNAVLSIRTAADILTQQLESFGPTSPDDAGRYAQTVAELKGLRPMLDDLKPHRLELSPDFGRSPVLSPCRRDDQDGSQSSIGTAALFHMIEDKCL